MHLGSCPLGHDVEILDVDVATEVRLRLWEIGLHRGARIRVTQRGPAGGRVLAVGGTRLALDAATAARVTVVPSGLLAAVASAAAPGPATGTSAPADARDHPRALVTTRP